MPAPPRSLSTLTSAAEGVAQQVKPSTENEIHGLREILSEAVAQAAGEIRQSAQASIKEIESAVLTSMQDAKGIHEMHQALVEEHRAHLREHRAFLQEHTAPVTPTPPPGSHQKKAGAFGSWSGQVKESGRSPGSGSHDKQPIPLNKDVEQSLIHLRQIIDNEDKKQRLAVEYEQRLREAEEGGNQQMGVMGRLTLRRRISFATEKTESMGIWHQRAIKLIGWWMFDAMIGFVIIANAAAIGVETTTIVEGKGVPLPLQILEVMFLFVYIAELGLRVFAVGMPVFGSRWVQFDAFLVVCGVLDTCLKVAFAGMSAAVLDKIMLVRLLRLVRLVRAARLVVQFRTLWLLVQGLYLSLIPMFWVFLIMVALIYLFGILGLELVGTGKFSNLGDAMVTLTQFILLDGAGPIYVDIMEETPLLGVYFFIFILLGSVSLMNLVTAIMVESSLRQAKDDHEAQKAWESLKRKQMEPLLMEIFHALDTDNSRGIDMEEIMKAPPSIKEQLLRICNMDDLQEVFEMLDYDDSGSVDIREFCDGIIRVQADKPAELIRLVKLCSDILKHSKWIYGAMKMQFGFETLECEDMEGLSQRPSQVRDTNADSS